MKAESWSASLLILLFVVVSGGGLSASEAQDAPGKDKKQELKGEALWNKACDHARKLLIEYGKKKGVELSAKDLEEFQANCHKVFFEDLTHDVADRMAHCFIKSEDAKTLANCDSLVPKEQRKKSRERQKSERKLPPKEYKEQPSQWYKACENVRKLFVTAVRDQKEQVTSRVLESYRRDCIEALINQSDTDKMTQCLMTAKDEASFRKCDELITDRRRKPRKLDSLMSGYKSYLEKNYPPHWKRACDHAIKLVDAHARKSGQALDDKAVGELRSSCKEEFYKHPEALADQVAACMNKAESVDDFTECEKLLELPPKK